MIRHVDRETIESDFKRHWVVVWRFMCDHCCRDYKGSEIGKDIVAN